MRQTRALFSPILRSFSKPPYFQPAFSFSAIVCLIVVMATFQVAHASGNGHFKEAKNLQTLAQMSQQSGQPILLMFGAQWCEHCQELDEQVFEPIAMGGNYDGKVVLMRHIGVDEQALIPGFDGKLIKKSEWAYQLNADLTPSVLFFDGFGNEVAPRIIGISNTHLYAGLIHSHLNIAYKNMNNPYRIPITPDLYELQLKNTPTN